MIDEAVAKPTLFARLGALAELLRISNVLTAVADVWMGLIVVRETMDVVPLAWDRQCILLTIVTVLLYSGGMVLNDVLDAERDGFERPTRPIPSGRVSWVFASGLGWGMLVTGVATAVFAGAFAKTLVPVAVAMGLAGCIVGYNHFLKTMWCGPIAMGLCRGLNVMLGFSVGMWEVEPQGFVTIAAGLTIYIAGVTLFARSEAVTSDRRQLVAGAGISLIGLLVLAIAPFVVEPPWIEVSTNSWWLLWGVIALMISRRIATAVLQPSPQKVQQAVGGAIQYLIVINAALAWGFTDDPFWGLLIFALLPPTMLMAKFVPQT